MSSANGLPADTLVLPIDLSALWVGDDAPMTADLAAHFDIQRNLDQAWLGQNAEREPFTRSVALQPGVYLHWRLPPALVRGQTVYHVDPAAFKQVHDSTGLQHQTAHAHRLITQAAALTRARLAQKVGDILTKAGILAAHASDIAAQLATSAVSANEFPTVPNRWKVTRSLGGSASNTTTWVVASDVLWSDENDDPQDPCALQNALSPTVLHLPASRSAITRETPLYRRLGRVISWAAYEADDEESIKGDRLTPFTALGYGNPMFSAALPHCMNVFGLWDPLDNVGNPQEVSYTVVGWYSDPADDPVAQAAVFGWIKESQRGAATNSLERTVLRGDLKSIDCKTVGQSQPKPNPVAVAIGNTTAEALSAAITMYAPALNPGLESYLNVLQLGLLSRLHDRHPGGLKEWDIELHRNDFAPVQGGTRWIVRPREAAAGKSAPPLPPNVGDALAELNRSQEALDRVMRARQAEREQLFADWTNYLTSKPSGAVSMARARERDGWRNIGRARLAAGVEAMSNSAHEASSVALRLRTARLALVEKLGAWEGGAAYQLQGVGAPRFWQPTDPVVLVWGLDAQPRPQLALPGQIMTLAQATDPGPMTSAVWNAADAWRSVLLAWEVSYIEDFPLGNGAAYPPRYVAAGFNLDPNDTNDVSDLQEPPPIEPKLFSGVVPLTGAAMTNLATQARQYVESYPADAGDSDGMAVQSSLKALAELTTAPILSQALSGFNERLLGRRQSLEFPVLDPHASSAGEFAFGLTVGKAVANGNRRGCVPEGMFNPVRAGHLILNRLWLIDTFGRVISILGEPDTDTEKDLANEYRITPRQVFRSERLAPVGDTSGRCSLRPRLLAPARLAFRWRSAADGAIDADHDPVNSPVVGWVLADHLDDSLDFYGPEGDAVGSLNTDGSLWQGAPGPNFGLTLARVLPDGPLRQTIAGLVAAIEASEGRAYLASLLGAVDQMTENILPNLHDQHPGLALLIGRPLAIVRATLDLELAAPPPIDQRIEAFTTPPDAGPRNTGGLAEILVPVKLGHRAYLNDGLVGYFAGPSEAPQTYRSFWVEEFDGQPPADAEAPGVRHPAADTISVSVSGAPVPLTLLIDPRSPIHATTGILPTKAVDLPARLFSAALSRMAVSFPVGPVVGPRDASAGMPLPLPEEPGFTWQFVHPVSDAWATTPVGPVPPLSATLPFVQDLYDGWAQLKPDAAKDASNAT